jgi:hypothetical protein
MPNKPTLPPENEKTIRIETTGKEALKKIAEIFTTPTTGTAFIINDANPATGLTSMNLIAQLNGQIMQVQEGNLEQVEAMLFCQAQSLQAIFTRYAERMIRSDQLHAMKVYGTLALKAQNQCRQTLAALAEIKNPKRTTFIKNTATNQQINVNQQGEGKISEKNSPISSNELLSEVPYAPLDTGRTEETSRTHPQLATVEESRG